MIGSVTGMQAQMLAAEKGRRKRAERELREEPELTPAHAAARAEMDESRAEQARKAIDHLEAEPGPGEAPDPAAPPDAERYDRPYLDAGHAAPSPMHDAPHSFRVPAGQHGILTPVELSAAPVVTGRPGPAMKGLAAHGARVIPSTAPRGS